MSQQDVANKCRVDRARIGKIENGLVEAQHMSLAEIAYALGVEVHEFLPPISTLYANYIKPE